MTKTLVLTNETMQEILENSNIRYKLLEQETLDQFKNKERRRVKLLNTINGLMYLGVVELDNNKKVISTKTFNSI
jgi:phage gp36-like protein